MITHAPLVIKPKILNSIYSSRENLRIPGTRVSNVGKPSQGDAIEENELVSLRTGNKQFYLARDTLLLILH